MLLLPSRRTLQEKNICSGYSLEAPLWGCNENPQHIFLSCKVLLMSTHNIGFPGEIKKEYLPDTHSYLDLCVVMLLMSNHSICVRLDPVSSD